MVYLTPTTATSGGFFSQRGQRVPQQQRRLADGHDARRRPVTGGGSTAGTQDKGLLTAGGIAAYATRQHTTANQDQAS